jgi:hypothetical protein
MDVFMHLFITFTFIEFIWGRNYVLDVEIVICK